MNDLHLHNENTREQSKAQSPPQPSEAQPWQHHPQLLQPKHLGVARPLQSPVPALRMRLGLLGERGVSENRDIWSVAVSRVFK